MAKQNGAVGTQQQGAIHRAHAPLRSGASHILVAAMLILATIAGDCIAEGRVVEKLDRGVVAVWRQQAGGVFVSWRNLVADPPGVAYNVYRSANGAAARKLNPAPLSGPTWFVDSSPAKGMTAVYTVRAVVDGKEREAEGSFALDASAPAQPYISIPLQVMEGYSPNDASVGDLDGDGEYEIVLHQSGRAHDNSHGGMTDPPVLQAYRLDGTLLWTINLGRNIREGAHYTQFMVYDLDGDGRAEVACKTADGTVDGKGKVIGDADASWANEHGWILAGPEFLTVFDGLTGAELATVPYVPARHPTNPLRPSGDQLKAVWGDGYGNRCDRFLACVAYLDGKLPSLVMCRGYYTRTVLAAWNWRDGKLTRVWTFDSSDPRHPGNRPFGGQGNHGLSVNDVDGDGRDEIVYGGMCIDDDGRGLYTTKLGHGDAMHVGDLNPEHPGLEVFRIQEPFADAGAHMFEAATGKVLWKKPSVSGGRKRQGPGRGVAFDIDPRYRGTECWVAGGGISGLFDCQGNRIGRKVPGSMNFGVWWDGDLLREILDRNWIAKWNWQESRLERILTAEDCASNNGSKATPCLSADMLGDWREEVLWRSKDGKELRIYTTTVPTPYRIPCLMQDAQYRLAITWQNVGYNQPPHPSYYLGEGMSLPPSGPATPETQYRSPTAYLIGDSTVNTRGGGKLGWGTPFVDLACPNVVSVRNRARGGRSSRTYFSEGLWEAVRKELRPGDFVIMQFGHNDGGGLNRNRSRASIKGTGEETQELVDEKTGKREVVHTYGWYLRRYCTDAIAAGATPIVCSPIPRNRWAENGTVHRSSGDYGKWARESAAATGAVFLDLNGIIADRYDKLGRAAVSETFFDSGDWTHTIPAGARENATCVAYGIDASADPRLASLQHSLKVAAAPPPEPRPFRGMVGVGTWQTQAEFRDVRVTQGDKVLFSAGLPNGGHQWQPKSGKWEITGNLLRQTSDAPGALALVGDRSWTDYTLTLKARKLGGREGFLILFGSPGDKTKCWWNLGGWGNALHAIDHPDITTRREPGKIETGRWYDIRVELKGTSVKAYLDGKLIHEETQ